ncbi:MAG: hypothetical protein ABSC19_00340 [Syntrophorhabdales bacterium]|jgi:hypothetical protein
MDVKDRIRRLEKHCARQAGEVIIRISRFSTPASQVPPADEQIARQRAEGKKQIIVLVRHDDPPVT